MLAACFLLFALTGLDIQGRVLMPRLSALIHLRALFPVALVAFSLHTTYAIHLALKRWHFWNGIGKTLLGLYGLINVALLGFYLFVQL